MIFISHIFAGYVIGIKRIWFIGDEFCERTYQKHYKDTCGASQSNSFFTFTKFEVRDFFSSSFSSHNRSALGRIINCLYKGLNQHTALPKLIVIVVVLDDDAVAQINCNERNCKDNVLAITRWLMNEFKKAIVAANDVLPEKAKRTPHVLWMAPPTHKYFGNYNNDQRLVQSECLQETIHIMANMSVLKLVKIWDSENANFFLYDAYRFTSNGLDAYWASIDAAIKFWFDVLSKKLDNTNYHSKKTPHHRINKFKWHRPSTSHWKPTHQKRRRHPTPP